VVGSPPDVDSDGAEHGHGVDSLEGRMRTQSRPRHEACPAGPWPTRPPGNTRATTTIKQRRLSEVSVCVEIRSCNDPFSRIGALACSRRSDAGEVVNAWGYRSNLRPPCRILFHGAEFCSTGGFRGVMGARAGLRLS
jgi:hypothetical protein